MSKTLTTTPISEQQEHCSNSLSDSGTGMEEAQTAEDSADKGGASRDKRDFPRAEIDTSAPFESVKEAASRFGGFGFWKPRRHEIEREIEGVDFCELEKHKALLAARLVEKESEMFDVLKELEHTNRLAGELKSRLQKEQLEQDMDMKVDAVDSNSLSATDRLDLIVSEENDPGVMGSYASPAPEVISMELSQEKTLSVSKASIELLNESIANERAALEMTRERVAANSLNISSLEKELDQTRKKLELMQDSGADEVSGDPMELSREIQRLSSETEELKRMGEAAKSEFFSAMLDIEQTKSRIRIAEMSLVAANTMKEAAKKAEEAALSELKRLTDDECLTKDDYTKAGVSLSLEEYEALVARARDAEQLSNERVQTAMLKVDEANVSKMEVLMKVERATEEVKLTKMVMDNAVRRVETATMGKLAVEEILRQRRSDHSKKRRAFSNSAKFKTVGPSQYRKEHSLHDVNGVNLVSNNPEPVLRPTLSIGQILNNKLQQLDQPESGMNFPKTSLKRSESLGQMLGRRDENSDIPIASKPEKAYNPEAAHKKSTKFTFTRFSLQLATQSKKKKTAATPRFMLCSGEP